MVAIPNLSDNYCYYCHPENAKERGFFVDVAEPYKIEAFMTAYGIGEPKFILTTHKHHDHSGGNIEML